MYYLENYITGYLLTDLETDRDILFQCDYDFPGLASSLGLMVESTFGDDIAIAAELLDEACGELDMDLSFYFEGDEPC